MILHKHKWVKIKETYAEPGEEVRGRGMSQDFIKSLMFGLTTILWECEICHKIRKEEMLGRDSHADL